MGQQFLGSHLGISLPEIQRLGPVFSLQQLMLWTLTLKMLIPRLLTHSTSWCFFYPFYCLLFYLFYLSSSFFLKMRFPRFCLWLSLLLSLYFFLLPLANLMVPAVFPCGWSQGKLPITEYPPEASHFLHIISPISHPFSASQVRRQGLREVQRLTQDTKTTQQTRARVRVWVQIFPVEDSCCYHYSMSPNDSASCLVSKSTSLLLWLVSPPHGDFLKPTRTSFSSSWRLSETHSLPFSQWPGSQCQVSLAQLSAFPLLLHGPLLILSTAKYHLSLRLSLPQTSPHTSAWTLYWAILFP